MSDTIPDPAVETANDDDNSLLTVDFAGLISMVKSGSKYYALLVEASRSSVRRPRLCRHDRYLVFPAGNELRGTEGGNFYTSFLGLDGQPYGFWNIDGCELQILPGGQAGSGLDPVATRPSFERVLDMDPYCQSNVDPWWFESPLSDEELVGARFLLEHGILESARSVDRSWAMRRLDDDSPYQPGTGGKYSQVVRYRIDAGSQTVTIQAYDWRADTWQRVRLSKGARIQVSNLCPVTATNADIEREVLAFYDLCQAPIDMARRAVPKSVAFLSGDGVPGKTACPPVKQTGGP